VCIDIDPLPYFTVEDPVYQIVCNNEQVNIDFVGTGWTYIWETCGNVGMPANGSGNISFIAQNNSNIPQFCWGHVSPWQGNCEGISESWGITVNPTPVVNPLPDLTVCPAQAVSVVPSGTAGATFSWTNSNPNIGLAASGTGNINFNVANLTTPQSATITVTPAYDDCPGDPVSFDITVPVTYVDEPPDLTVCPGDAISVPFSGNGTTYNWTNANPAVGLPASGSGNISFTAIGSPVQQTAVVTVTPTGGVCPVVENFSVIVLPLPAVNQPAAVGVCSGETVDVAFSGSAGATFNWTNDNPNIGLPASGTGNIDFPSAVVTQAETANITVTPVLGPCSGVPRTVQVFVNPRPAVSPVPDRSVCTGDAVSVVFSGTPGAVFNWTNTNPGIGLSLGGSGDLAFTATALPTSPQTGLISVTPFDGTCFGEQETFQITVKKCCETFAGNMDTLGSAVCGPKPIPVKFLQNDSLETGDSLHFILYANPGSPTGSVLYETDTLYFPFLPGLTAFDSTFYVSAIAGNGLAGDSIDRADPCLDVSNPQPVRWLAKPTISAVSTGHELCANGGCMTVDFVFTGHPPFAFAWVLEQGGQVLYSRSEVAAGFALTMEVCAEDFFLPYAGGNLEFRVTGLVDAFCDCAD